MKTALIHITQLVTCKGSHAKHGKEMSEIGVIENGCVVMEGETIEAVGSMKELAQKYDFDQMNVIDCSGKTVLPGFVDSHTHLVFGGYRADEFDWRLKGMSYMDIMLRGGGIQATTDATRTTSKEDLKKSAKRRLKSVLQFGVTTLEAKSGYGLDGENEIKQLEVVQELQNEQPVELVSTFMGAHSVSPQYKGREEEFIRYLIDEVLPVVKERNLAEFCDIFCEDNVFSVEQSRLMLTEAQKMGFGAKIHADEIVTLNGAGLAAEIGAVSADHLLHASDEGLKALANSKTIATCLPATAFCLNDTYANARKMIDLGCAVAVASDLNPGSCFCESIPLIIFLCTMYMHMTIEETVTALTINGAAAIRREHKVGSIEPGKQADMVILEWPSIHFLPYHTAVNSVEKVVKKGKLVYERA